MKPLTPTTTPSLSIDRRIPVALLVLALIAIVFWTGSRYPSLNDKAAMGGELVLEDPLGFDAAFAVDPEDPAAVRIAYTTLNWVATNRQGMTFGVLFAAACLTLLSCLKRTGYRSKWANTLLGVSVGAPLGVCVNCAAPIARGMHAAGARLETTLATLISSPTLNIVVLVILFSLFPFYLAVLKVAATLLFVLVFIPLLSHFVFKREGQAPDLPDMAPGTACALPSVLPTVPFTGSHGWLSALSWVARAYGANLWFIVKTTVPLMFLAGLLGAAIVTLLPWEVLVEELSVLPRWEKILAVGGVAALGLFLPVPIAFDLFICAALLAAGLQVREVMILLFTLGIFSVYSFLIVGRGISWRVAVTMAVALTGLGIATGMVAGHVERWVKEREVQSFLRAFSTTDAGPPPRSEAPRGSDDRALIAELRRQAVEFMPVSVAVPAGIEVHFSPYQAQQEPTGDTLFLRQDGPEFGLRKGERNWLVHKYILPFAQSGAIAAGDVHGDGRPDLLLSSNDGLLLYANIGGRRFEQQAIGIPRLRGTKVGSVALVDLDNDGWLDIFLSSLRDGNWVIHNREGRFLSENLQALPANQANLAHAAAFADIDQDGRLEVILGNYMVGHTYLFLEEARNVLLRNLPDGLVAELLPGIPGETLSMLFSDIDGNGWTDLLVGNDFQIPDSVYLGGEEGSLRLTGREDAPFSRTTYSTMSIDSADLDNDLQLEVFFGQITGSMFADHARLQTRRYEAVCADFPDGERKRHCVADMQLHKVVNTRRFQKDLLEMFGCRRLEDEANRQDCIALELYRWSSRYREAKYCNLFPERWSELSGLCGYLERGGERFKKDDLRAQIPQQRKGNLLFFRDANGEFVDRAEAWGVDIVGWTWNARFADLDNDQWQDLYLANGWYGSRRRETNLFFHNHRGEGFTERTGPAGLEDYLATGSYVYVDLEQDGDLDIVTVPFQSEPWIYRNQTRNRNSITVELRDHRGNHFGIGSSIVVHYGGEEAKHQLREIKSGGGYLSFDAPRAHFGLGPYDRVERIEVSWSTGEKTVLRGSFAAGGRYRIVRRAVSDTLSADDSTVTAEENTSVSG